MTDADGDPTDLWVEGSYAEVASNYLSMAGRLVERAGVTSDDEVLDVGCGPGGVAITAARRGATVAGLDVTPGMLERAAENADIAGEPAVTWHEGDATDLPFEADAFDATLSNLGHMYGDPPAVAARELLRVTRPGGRVGFTSWTPTSCYPALAGLLSTRLSTEDLPSYSEPPFMWGDPGTVRERLAPAVDEPAFETRTASYPALSPAHFWEELLAHSGTFGTSIEAVSDRAGLREAAIERIESHFDPTRNAVELEYLLTTATVGETA